MLTRGSIDRSCFFVGNGVLIKNIIFYNKYK